MNRKETNQLILNKSIFHRSMNVQNCEYIQRRPRQFHLLTKLMGLILWDAHGIIFIDYLQKGKIINGEYYGNLLPRLSNEIKKKCPHVSKKKVLFHQDNAPVHISVIAIAKINVLKFKLLPHASYKPDLALSGYFLFPNLKKWSSSRRFANSEEVVSVVNGYFKELGGSHFKQDIEAIEHRCPS